MKRFSLSAMALIFSASLAYSQQISITEIKNVDALPCSIFLNSGPVGSLKEGVSLELSLSSNNDELFSRLADRMSQCRYEADSTIRRFSQRP